MANIFHKDSIISNKASIDISTRGSDTIIGANSQIDDFVRIKHVGGIENVKIGDFVYINSGTVIYSGNGISIGDNVLIGPNCSITPVNHAFMNKTIIMRLQGFNKSKGGIIIEDDVWIGSGVTILDGSVIKKGAVIGANSLVNGIIEEYSINYGSPCKKVGNRE